MYVERSAWTKSMKIFVFHLNVHQKVTSTEDLIITWIELSILWMPVSIFPRASPNGPMNKEAMTTRIEAWAQQHRLPLNLSQSGYNHHWVSVQPASSKHWVSHTTPFLRCPASYLVAVWLHWASSNMNGTVFCSYWNKHSVNIHSVSLYTICVPKLSSVGLQTTLSTLMIFHTALFVFKEPTSWQSKCSSGPMLMEFADLAVFPTIWSRIKCWNCLWKIQLQHQIGGHTFWRASISRKLYMLWISIQYIVSPIVRIHASRI